MGASGPLGTSSRDRGAKPEGERGVRVAIGLGSNLGDRLAHLAFGVWSVGTELEGLRVSSVYESEPACKTDQPRFLNLCCVGRSRRSARSLLELLQQTERAAGRPPPDRRPRFGPRTLDLDLLLFGETVMNDPELTVPHPRLRERAFVLVPLAELAPEWMVPAVSAIEQTAPVGVLARGIDRAGLRRVAPPPDLDRLLVDADGS